MGMVIIQAAAMVLPTPQRTAEKRLVAPVPIIAPVMEWVVLTGTPNCEAASMTMAPEVSAEKPSTGRRLVTLAPNVLITRHPPQAVPTIIASAGNTKTHHGGLSQ